MANKYWEEEAPEIFRFGKNEIRYYKKAGKIQIYPIVANSPNGVGRGSTIDLQSMNPTEITQLKDVLTNICEEAAEDEMVEA